MVAFHALSKNQPRTIKVTDIVNSRLATHQRTIPLAGPVLIRLSAYLDYRARTWRETTNPPSPRFCEKTDEDLRTISNAGQ